MRPTSDELADGRARIETLDVTVEQAGLVVLVADGHVACAPPDLKRHPGERDLPRTVEGAAGFVSARIRGGCAAERADPMTIDVQPGDGMLRDRTHSREVANLPWVTP